MTATITALSADYAAGRSDPVAVLEACMGQIGADQQHADSVFTRLTGQRAQRAARESAARWREGRPLGALDGIPLVWKDVFDMAGEVTTCGSASRHDARPARQDAELVRQLESCGVVSVGRTTLSEFAYSGLGINPVAGTPENPWDASTRRIVGGSSSGSAAAVARGWVPCGMGSDTSGSIRVPAALLGLVGFKPSSGRYPSQGMFPLAPSLDVAGPLVRSVADAQLLDCAITGASARPSRLQDWTFIVPSGRALASQTAQVQATFHAVLGMLGRAGVTVVERSFAPFEQTRALFDQHGTLVAVEAADVHRALLQSERLALVDPRIAQRMQLGAQISAQAAAVLKTRRAEMIATSRAHLPPGEILLYPTVCMTAPEIAPLEGDAALFAQCNAQILQNTMLSSYLDMPTLSLPAGLASDGLPVGVSLSLPCGLDAQLLGIGASLQSMLRTD